MTFKWGTNINDYEEQRIRTENLVNCLKCSLANALIVLLGHLLVQKDHFEVNELIRV